MRVMVLALMGVHVCAACALAAGVEPKAEGIEGVAGGGSALFIVYGVSVLVAFLLGGRVVWNVQSGKPPVSMPSLPALRRKRVEKANGRELPKVGA